MASRKTLSSSLITLHVMAEDCNFCSPNGCNLGIQKFVKTAEGDLQDILTKFKNERQVDDQIVLSLGEGFRDENAFPDGTRTFY